MNVEIKEGLKIRLFESIVNELEYMVNETSEPKDYQLEINAFIDFMLATKDKELVKIAENYAERNKERVYG